MLDRSDLVARATVLTTNVITMVTSRMPMYELRADATPAPLAGATKISSFDTAYPLLSGIISVRAENIAGTTGRRLKKRNIQWFDSLGSRTATSALPAAYCRHGGNLELYPTLSENLNLVIRYWKRHPVDATPGNTTIVTHESWNELYKWEVYYRLLIHIGEHDKAMGLVVGTQMPYYPAVRKVRMVQMGIIPRLWNELMLTVDQREGIDDDFGIRPRMS